MTGAEALFYSSITRWAEAQRFHGDATYAGVVRVKAGESPALLS